MTDTPQLLVVGPTTSTLRYALAKARDAVVVDDTPVVVTVLVAPGEVPALERRLASLDVPPDVTVDIVGVPDILAAVRERAGDVEQVLAGHEVDVARIRDVVETPVELVPGGRRAHHRHLRHRVTSRRFVGTFLVSYAFYLLLGDPFSPFDLITGAAAAGVVAATLAPVVFETPPTVGRTLPRVARATLFLPYLLYEIVRANVAIAAVILNERLGAWDMLGVVVVMGGILAVQLSRQRPRPAPSAKPG